MTRLGSLALLVLIGSALPAASARAQSDSEFLPLTAWTTERKGATARPGDDSLLLADGTIRTTTLYADFVFRFEYRLPTPDARGQFLLRSFFDQSGRPARGYSVALDGTAGRGRVRGQTQSLREKRLATPGPVADGSWVACEVRAEDDRLTVAMDGVVVSEASRLDGFAGFFGFTGTSGGVELRGLRVAPLGVRLDDFPDGLLVDTAAPGVTPPAAVRREDPIFPPAPRAQGIQGVVLLEIALDSSGRLTHARVVKSPHPDFVVAALVCARKWRFSPAMKDGTGIAVKATMEVAFNLKR